MVPAPRLRILMVSAHYPPIVNGYAIQCRDTSDLLAARGHDVRVLTTAGPARAAGDGAPRLTRLRNAPSEGYVSLHPAYLARQLRRRWIFQANARECDAVTRAFRPDVALVWQFDTIGLAVVRALHRRGVPVVFNVGDYSLGTLVALLRRRSRPLDHARQWLHDVDIAQLDLSHLILVSSELRAWYQAQGFPARDMTVIHNGIPSAAIAQAPPPPGPGTRMLFVGRLHPTKGVSLAIQALAIANRRGGPTLTLDIVGTGDPDYVAQLRALVGRLGAGDRVRFLGPRDRATVLGLYREYDVLLFPGAWVEPFGITVIEAMAQGLPVIALDRGGPSEIIRHMVDGVLVRDDGADAYAEAIRMVADAPSLRSRLGAAAIRRVMDGFTLERHVALTERLLHRVVGSTRDDAVSARRA